MDKEFIIIELKKIKIIHLEVVSLLNNNQCKTIGNYLKNIVKIPKNEILFEKYIKQVILEYNGKLVGDLYIPNVNKSNKHPMEILDEKRHIITEQCQTLLKKLNEE